MSLSLNNGLYTPDFVLFISRFIPEFNLLSSSISSLPVRLYKSCIEWVRESLFGVIGEPGPTLDDKLIFPDCQLNSSFSIAGEGLLND